MAADPHGWASWQEYLNAHNGKLATFADHFIVEDRLQPTITPELVHWLGELVCVDGIRISVDRRQDVRERHGTIEVITREYSYQAIRRTGSTTRQILRYDNIGVHGHADKHHRHVFDGGGNETTEWVGKANWPNFGQVLDEIYDCWSHWKAGETDSIVSRR